MSNYPITINFTPAEWDIIEHRLAVPCAIADALTEYPGTFIVGDREAYIESADQMAVKGPDVTLRGTIDLDVLMDAIEGSTMPYQILDLLDGTKDEVRCARSRQRNFKTIELKFAAATGVSARFPKY